ncbi:hypothetical protein [Rhabdothermincola salaria]|uniref:hypothetical protein n=1 Tax=Rhabdothermincola salaria TaxID=2903142 RepID=UPI001E391AF5|nr:hypothetical protein [Rhabdothermincola salaria]MCD9624277.1 hypothetical protein [Rhabdothermincola salaria]
MTRADEVRAEVAVAALLDVDCLAVALADDELVTDVALWGAAGNDGATDVLATHPRVHTLVASAVASTRPQVRATVAGRPDLDTELYAILASDDHPAVRARVATNPAAPGAVVRHLAADDHEAVRRLAHIEVRRRRQAA